MVITRRWSLEGRGHAGLILTSDARWPRSRDGAGALITAVAAGTNGPLQDWSDRIHWLWRAGDGNRTRMTSLEGWGSAIELHPHAGYRPDECSGRARPYTFGGLRGA